MTDPDSVSAASSGSGRDLFRRLLHVVNDPTALGAFTARLVEAGDLTEFEVSFCGGRIENVRTPGNPALLPRVIGGGRKGIEKRMSGRPNEVKEDAAALHSLLVSERVLPPEEIDECLSRLVSRCLLPLVANDAPEVEWRDDAPSFDEPLGLEFDPCFRAMFENGWRRGALGALTPEGSAVLVGATSDWRGLPGQSGEACETVFRLVDGVRTVDDIVRDAGLDEALVRYALARLQHAGYLRDFDPGDLLEAAQKARREGRLDIALRYYRQAEESGGSAEAALESARIYEIMGLADEAKGAFSRYADRCERGGRIEEALRWFQAFVAANPGDFESRSRLASIRARAGQTDTAVAEWRAIAAERAKAGDSATAVRCFRSILDHGGAPRDGAFYEEFLDVLQHEPDGKRAAADLRALKRRFLEERDPERALRAMERLRDSGEARPDDRLDHANVLITAGRIPEAQAELEIVTASLRATNPEPGGPDWDLLAGVCEMMVGFDPKHLEARLFLARDAAQSGRREKAVQHYEAYLDALGEDSDPALFDAALQETLALDPANARAVFSLADAHVRQGETRQAIDLLVSHADAASTGGNADAARRLFERLLKLDPWHSGANAALAETHSLRGDPDASSACRRRLAHAHVRESRFDEAERCLRDLATRDPADPTALSHLADLLEARQDRDGLLAVLAEMGEAALRANNFGVAERTARRLRSIDPESAAAVKLESAVKVAASATSKEKAPSEKKAPEAEAPKRAASPQRDSEVKPAAKTGARHAPPVAPARTMPAPAPAAPPKPMAVAKPVPPDPSEEMTFVVPDDSPDEDPFSQPPSVVSAESFGKILSSLKSLNAPAGGDAAADEHEASETDSESVVVDDVTDAEAESRDPQADSAETPSPAPAGVRPAALPTAPVPPEGDVEFSSILQSLKNLKLR